MTSTRRVLVALIVAASAAFVVGVLLERHETHSEPAESTASGPSAEHNQAREREERAEHNEAGSRRERNESEEHNEGNATTPTGAPTTETTTRSEPSEKLLGVNPESTGLLAVAVAVSLVLAAGIWGFGALPSVLVVVALAMATFGALDVREVVHQADESRTGLMVLAGLVAVLHVAAALVAARGVVAARASGPPAASAHAS